MHVTLPFPGPSLEDGEEGPGIEVVLIQLHIATSNNDFFEVKTSSDNLYASFPFPLCE